MSRILALSANEVERALFDLIAVRSMPDVDFVFTESQWKRISALLGVEEMPGGSYVGKEEFKNIQSNAIANAQAWVEANSVSAAIPVAIACERLAGSPDLFDQIHVIADTLEPFEIAWLTAMEGGASAEIEATAKAFNQATEENLDWLARITPNSKATLQQLFRPDGSFFVYFGAGYAPTRFLRNAALHKSFNTEHVRSKEVAMAKQLLMARIPNGSECLNLQDAAVAISKAQVPVIARGELGQPSALALEKELLKLGVVEQYSANFNDAISSCHHIAYVVRHDGASDKPDDFVFWPANRARNFIEVLPLPSREPSEQLPAPSPA